MGFFSQDIKNMDDLFMHTLRDIYYAEKQIVQALPEMIRKIHGRAAQAGVPVASARDRKPRETA